MCLAQRFDAGHPTDACPGQPRKAFLVDAAIREREREEETLSYSCESSYLGPVRPRGFRHPSCPGEEDDEDDATDDYGEDLMIHNGESSLSRMILTVGRWG